MAEKIYIMAEDGNLESMDETPFATEDVLQELIADHPELLAGEQMDPNNPRRWILITREKGISETIESARRWSIDHVFIDQDARPTLVEVKRGSSTEIRRTVVGQLLEYAAHATITWGVDDLRSIFKQRNPDDHTELIAQLLQKEESEEVEDPFWGNVENNLKTRNLRLLFVADEIPDSLARIVEFLNAQMSSVEVLAVEIKQFKGESSLTLVPRVIGRLAANRNRTTGANMTTEEFLGKFNDERVRGAVECLINVAVKSGNVSFSGSTRLAIQVRCPLHRNPVTVAWLAPPSEVSNVQYNGHFVFGTFQDTKTFSEEIQSSLQEWNNEFASRSGFDRVEPFGFCVAYAISHADAVKQQKDLASRLKAVINDLANLEASETI